MRKMQEGGGVKNDDWPYAVSCPSCGWFGMSDDCRHNECPGCGRRVVKEKPEREMGLSSTQPREGV